MEFQDVVRARTAVRKFEDREVEQDKIDRTIKLAVGKGRKPLEDIVHWDSW